MTCTARISFFSYGSSSDADTRATMVATGMPPTSQGPIHLQHNKADCAVTSKARPPNKDKWCRGSSVTGWQQQRALALYELISLHLGVRRVPGSNTPSDMVYFPNKKKTGTPVMIRLACPETDIYRQPHTCADNQTLHWRRKQTIIWYSVSVRTLNCHRTLLALRASKTSIYTLEVRYIPVCRVAKTINGYGNLGRKRLSKGGKWLLDAGRNVNTNFLQKIKNKKKTVVQTRL